MERRRFFGIKPDNPMHWQSVKPVLTEFTFANNDTRKLDAIYRVGMTEKIYGVLERPGPTKARLPSIPHEPKNKT